MPRLRLSGGALFDPANGVEGQIADLWIEAGFVVDRPPQDRQSEFKLIDCSGRVIMPGGVDIHSHLAGPKVNLARKLQPELAMEGSRLAASSLPNSAQDWRTCGNRTVPTIMDTGRKYLGLGYTTAFDAAIAPTAARATRAELSQLPYLDAGYYLLLGNHHLVFELTAKRDRAGLARFVAWVLDRCGGYGVKLVNPGGVENFKRHRNGNAKDLDVSINGFGVTPRQVIAALANAADELRLPHPIHVHCNNLGMPGNWSTTLDTLKTLDGRRGHLAHIQFHSYGGVGEDETAFCSRVQPLADYVNAHPEISLDVGQILFGSTTSMTGDNALGYYLSRLSGKKYYSCDTEIESGCGISPIEYKEKNFVHAMQWAIGLEWFLSVRNPWQIALSTDHPNGASFLAYPHIIRMLMDGAFRRERLREVNPRVFRHSPLADMNREYGLNEIAIVTRAAPARMLGLANKGHLGAGADADVTIYSPNSDFEQMFQFPWMVIKGGALIVRDGELLASEHQGRVLSANLELHGPIEEFDEWVRRHYSFDSRHFGIR